MEKGVKSLDVYKLAFSLAIKLFNLTRPFPAEEKYSLTDQIRRSSRSVCANLAEAYRKRQYPRHFSSKISDADAECSETLVWLDFSLEFGYINTDEHEELVAEYQRVGQMLGKMLSSPERFIIKT